MPAWRRGGEKHKRGKHGGPRALRFADIGLKSAESESHAVHDTRHDSVETRGQHYVRVSDNHDLVVLQGCRIIDSIGVVKLARHDVKDGLSLL